MKKILVPTDFSEHANNALRYAINIGNYFEAEIELLHVYEMHSIISSTTLVREYLKEDAERDLSDNIRSFKDLVFGKTILKGRSIDGGPRAQRHARARAAERRVRRPRAHAAAVAAAARGARTCARSGRGLSTCVRDA